MRLARVLAMGAVLATFVLMMSSEGLLSQEKKDPPKLKGYTPSGWGKLGLTATQKEAIYKVQAKYKEEVSKLEAQIADLKSKERKEMIAVLTDEQKKMLAEGLEPSKDKEKPKEKAKDGKEKDKN